MSDEKQIESKEKEVEVKIGFLKRIGYSITKIENYPIMASNRTRKSFYISS